ncbi:flagellar export protein FliJ [Noviherbaspirillum denitrificans]|uniref:Flagellar FliJ protein n=1 Tax=Noviherbaspirillum denitrificans TaxID=1968433 RepID=A0A254TGK3_9BURK|nr:flagellar export protein FliJ [Noviherbaspirillum denitrificans]OWW18808.1 flagellar biosynthesis protein FliJ [Noviherbaspirillum denitrificans]
MAMNSALDTLIELATSQTDEAAKRLGLAIRACEDTEQKLAMLLQYRDEYEARFQTSLAGGVTAAGYRNFQLFLEKLDMAIDGQQKIVDDAKRRIVDERSEWQSCERKRMSYDTLATRMQKAAEHKANKLDQKLMDEFATRQSNYKR